MNLVNPSQAEKGTFPVRREIPTRNSDAKRNSEMCAHAQVHVNTKKKMTEEGELTATDLDRIHNQVDNLKSVLEDILSSKVNLLLTKYGMTCCSCRYILGGTALTGRDHPSEGVLLVNSDQNSYDFTEIFPQLHFNISALGFISLGRSILQYLPGSCNCFVLMI